MRLDFTLEVPRPRFVVVHYHFFKNAGSTIESILEREFAGEFEKRYRELWGSAAYDDLLTLNQFDLQLHAAAVDEVDSRSAIVPKTQEGESRREITPCPAQTQ